MKKISHFVLKLLLRPSQKGILVSESFSIRQTKLGFTNPELFYLMRRSSEPLICHFFGGLSKSEKISELKPTIIHELYRQIKVGGLEITETSYLVNGLENYLFLIMMALKTT